MTDLGCELGNGELVKSAVEATNEVKSSAQNSGTNLDKLSQELINSCCALCHKDESELSRDEGSGLVLTIVENAREQSVSASVSDRATRSRKASSPAHC